LDFNVSGDAFVSYECSDQRIAYKKVGQTAWTEIKLTMAGSFPDRDMVVIDKSPSSPFFGSVYIGYDDNGVGNVPFVLVSRDGFSNWKRSARVAGGNPTIGVTSPPGRMAASTQPGKMTVARRSGPPSRARAEPPLVQHMSSPTIDSTPRRSSFPFRLRPAAASSLSP
jgi:hypothetical protein